MMRLIGTLAMDTSEDPLSFLDSVRRAMQDSGHPLDHPGAIAAIDQHGAAVRDALSPGAGVVSAGDVAAYVRGIIDVAAVRVWHDMPAQTQLWLRLRLASTCTLASELGYLPASSR